MRWVRVRFNLFNHPVHDQSAIRRKSKRRSYYSNLACFDVAGNVRLEEARNTNISTKRTCFQMMLCSRPKTFGLAHDSPCTSTHISVCCCRIRRVGRYIHIHTKMDSKKNGLVERAWAYMKRVTKNLQRNAQYIHTFQATKHTETATRGKVSTNMYCSNYGDDKEGSPPPHQ